MSQFTHELNNLLTVVQGFGQLAIAKLDPEHPASADLKEVLAAAKKAIELIYAEGAAEKGISLRAPEDP
jgi:hypothetical protein